MNDLALQSGEQWLQDLLLLMGVNTTVRTELATTSPLDDETSVSQSYWLTIDDTNLTPEQIRILIGADASVIDGMQYLVNSVFNLNQLEESITLYTVELNGYRLKRQAEIINLAETAAAEVRFSGREVEIKSLNPGERRMVHNLLKDFTDLETFSRGREPQRHLVVKPAFEA
jgi:spoIIIJ-associated protein